MKARCAQCHHVFPVSGSGTQTCPKCGASLTIHLPGLARPQEAAYNTSNDSDGFQEGSTPVGPAPEDSAPVEPTPWERRHELGFFKALIDTAILSVKSSDSFFGRMPRDNSNGAISYYWIICGFSSVMTTLWSRLTNTFMPISAQKAEQLQSLQAMSDMAKSSGNGLLSFFSDVALGMIPGASGGNAVLGMTCMALGSFIMVPIIMLMHAACLHLCCLIVGAGKSGFSATLRAVGYACAPMLASVIPVCGNVIGGMATIVFTVIGLSKLHGVSKGRAAVAFLLPVILACCLGALAAIVVGGSMASSSAALMKNSMNSLTP